MSPQIHIGRKIGKIRGYVRELGKFRGVTSAELSADLQKRAALERFLYLACDSMISLMEMIIVEKKYERAENYSENIDVLLERQDIIPEQAEILHKIVGLRNALSHDYENLNLQILSDIVQHKLSEFNALLDFFEKTYV